MKTKTWTQKMAEARTLARKSNGHNWERAKLLAEVEADDAFHEECRAKNLSASELLNDEVADLCCTAYTLFAVLEEYPNRADWERNALADMVAEVARKADDTVKKTRANPVPSYKEQCKELKKRVAELESEIRTLKEALSIIGNGVK